MTEKDLDFLRSSPGLPHYVGAPSSSNTSPYRLGSSEAVKEIESPYFIESASRYVPDHLNQHSLVIQDFHRPQGLQRRQAGHCHA